MRGGRGRRGRAATACALARASRGGAHAAPHPRAPPHPPHWIPGVGSQPLQRPHHPIGEPPVAGQRAAGVAHRDTQRRGRQPQGLRQDARQQCGGGVHHRQGERARQHLSAAAAGGRAASRPLPPLTWLAPLPCPPPTWNPPTRLSREATTSMTFRRAPFRASSSARRKSTTQARWSARCWSPGG